MICHLIIFNDFPVDMLFQKKFLMIYLSCFLINACSPDALDRLSKIGKEPTMSPIVSDEKYIQYAIPEIDNIQENSNSLWSSDSKMLFQNVRVNKLGDIVTVRISINDQAKIDNKSERERSSNEQLTAPILGSIPTHLFGKNRNASAKIINMQGDMSNYGSGKIERKDSINLYVAATVIKILPSGNLVIQGSQEIKVNYDVRTIYISGIVRSEDIDMHGVVEYTKIADLRVNYGGHGHVYAVQQPRLGSQILDIISPF